MSKFSIKTQVDDNLIKEMIEIDKLFFKDEDVGNFDRCKGWVEANSDIYTVLMQDDKVIGCINFMPITEDAYQRVLKGELKDYQLETGDIIKFESGKSLKCFLVGITIREEFQDTEAII